MWGWGTLGPLSSAGAPIGIRGADHREPELFGNRERASRERLCSRQLREQVRVDAKRIRLEGAVNVANLDGYGTRRLGDGAERGVMGDKVIHRFGPPAL